jgi:hypothetical protein
MTAIKDVMTALKEVLLLTEKVTRTGEMLSEVARDLREHDRRLVRLETLVDLARSKSDRLISD